MAVNGNQTEARNSTEHSSIGTYVPNIDRTDALPLKRASAFKSWRPKAGEETSGPSNSGSGKRPLDFDLNEMPRDQQHEGPSFSGSRSGEMPLEIYQLDIVSESNAAQRLDNAALMNQGAEDEACVRGTESSHVNSQGAFTGEVPLFYEIRQREGEMRLGKCNTTTSSLVQKPTTSPKVHPNPNQFQYPVLNQTQFFSGSSSNPCRAPKSLFRNQGVAASSSIGNENHRYSPGFLPTTPNGLHHGKSQSAFSKRQANPPRKHNTGDTMKREIMYEGMSAVEYLNLFIATHPDIIPSMAHMYQKDMPTMMEPPLSFFSRISNGNPAPAVPENEVCSLNQNPADIEFPDDLLDSPGKDAKRQRYQR